MYVQERKQFKNNHKNIRFPIIFELLHVEPNILGTWGNELNTDIDSYTF